MDKLGDGMPLGDASQTIAGKNCQWRSPERHQWFHPWKIAIRDNFKTLVEGTGASVRHHEEHTKARGRARRAADKRHHIRRIEAVVCNLAHAVLLPPPTGRIATKLGKSSKPRSRYDSPLLGKPISPLVWMLQDVGLLNIQWPSVQRGKVSSIAPSPWFASKVHECGVRLCDFGRDETEEVVLLTRNSREETAWWDGGPPKLYREAIDYVDRRLVAQGPTSCQQARADGPDLILVAALALSNLPEALSGDSRDAPRVALIDLRAEPMERYCTWYCGGDGSCLLLPE